MADSWKQGTIILKNNHLSTFADNNKTTFSIIITFTCSEIFSESYSVMCIGFD